MRLDLGDRLSQDEAALVIVPPSEVHGAAHLPSIDLSLVDMKSIETIAVL